MESDIPHSVVWWRCWRWLTGSVTINRGISVIPVVGGLVILILGSIISLVSFVLLLPLQLLHGRHGSVRRQSKHKEKHTFRQLILWRHITTQMSPKRHTCYSFVDSHPARRLTLVHRRHKKLVNLEASDMPGYPHRVTPCCSTKKLKIQL